MNNIERNERMDNPAKRFMREIEMLMTDSEKKDIAEVWSSVGSELPRALEAAVISGMLTSEQKESAARDLTNIREDVTRMEDSPEKDRVLRDFDSLLEKLQQS